MRKFRNRPGELERFMDGTRPALSEMEGADLATAQRRLEQIRSAMGRAVDATPGRAADQVLTTSRMSR